MARRECRAFRMSDNGKEYCQGKAGHRWHWYWVGECKIMWRNKHRETPAKGER